MKETTEWDDILDKFGIKKAVKEPAPDEKTEVSVCRNESDNSDLDDEDEDVLRRYRELRIAELMSSKAEKPHFGSIEEITGHDFVEKVCKAGPDVCVVVHLYKQGIITCSLLNQFMGQLATKFPETKFLKSISDLCIPNFPDENLPGLLIYRNAKCLKQIFGPHNFPANMRLEDLEWMLHKSKAIVSDIEEDPRKSKSTKVFEAIGSDSDDE